jgi:hypothetical protein
MAVPLAGAGARAARRAAPGGAHATPRRVGLARAAPPPHAHRAARRAARAALSQPGPFSNTPEQARAAARAPRRGPRGARFFRQPRARAHTPQKASAWLRRRAAALSARARWRAA